MYKHKLEDDYRNPLELGLLAFDGKWKTRVICALSNSETGVLRYTELKQLAAGVTDAVLANTLKELIEYEIINRQQFNEMPMRVEYSLTEKGVASIPMLKEICEWTQKYNPEAQQLRCGCGQNNCQFDVQDNKTKV